MYLLYPVDPSLVPSHLGLYLSLGLVEEVRVGIPKYSQSRSLPYF